MVSINHIAADKSSKFNLIKRLRFLIDLIGMDNQSYVMPMGDG